MSGKRHKKWLWLDPRAKLFLILMCVLSSMFAPSLAYQFVLVMLIAVLGAFFGKWKYVIKAVCFYAVICALTVWIMAEMTGTLRTMFIAFLGLFHKVYACGTLAGIVLTTTKVNEFLSAMNRVHAPKKLVIPMAVMLRYMQKRSTVYGSSGSAFTTTVWAPSRFQAHFLYRHPMCR